jgi:hypothetical protein
MEETTALSNSSSFSNSSDVTLDTEGTMDLFAGFDDTAPVTETTGEAEEAAESSGEESEETQVPFSQDTTRDEEPAAETEATPTTEQQPQPDEAGDLTFNAKINHQEQSVTLRRDELPTIYQKAQNMDRAVQRANEAKEELGRYKAMVDQAMGLAKVMNFSGETPEATIEAMVNGISETARNSQVSAMVEAGTAQEVAEYIVDQRMKDARESVAETEVPASSAETETAEPMAPPTTEQFSADLQTLFQKRPELRSTQTPFPDQVLKAYMNGENLTAAYLEYEARQNAQELETLRKQNQVYQQNEAAAQKAPIKKGVSASGGTQQQEDPMLVGFDDPYW